MFDSFWKDAEIISVYTDEDAREDGYLIDVSALSIEFNGKTINRLTCGASAALQFETMNENERKIRLKSIAFYSWLDGSGVDAWGIYENDCLADGGKLWLIPNEVNGYSLMQPSEY
ncbi:MAG: hypothetical protein M3209_00065 [Acidobacteriota bacterium]|nr:hypothetical protein [Acidobacteriota bacterium]